jgi:hypothetical protein
MHHIPRAARGFLGRARGNGAEPLRGLVRFGPRRAPGRVSFELPGDFAKLRGGPRVAFRLSVSAGTAGSLCGPS